MEIAKPALALSDPTVMAREKEAKKACLSASQYEKGIDILAELYAETNHATYIYNQGRCYQQNGMNEKARGRFLEYRRKNPYLSEKDLIELEQRIAECENQLPSMVPAKAVPAPPAPTTQETVIVQSTPPNTVLIDAPSPMVETKNPGRRMRVASAIISGVGFIGIGIGVSFNYLHDHKTDSAKKETYADTLKQDADDHRVYSLIGYGVGAVALVTGISLYVLSSPSNPSEAKQGSKFSLVPSFTHETTTLYFRGRF
jgi:hypothetical protein